MELVRMEQPVVGCIHVVDYNYISRSEAQAILHNPYPGSVHDHRLLYVPVCQRAGIRFMDSKISRLWYRYSLPRDSNSMVRGLAQEV